MTHLFQIFILAFVEGLTEFLPVSSTGHMIIVSHWLQMPQDEALKAFEVIIQLAAIFAIMLIYRQQMRLKKWRLWLKVLLAFLPVAIIGFIFAHQVKSLFLVPVVATMFIIGGLALIVLEHFYKTSQKVKINQIDQVSWQAALKVGLWQVLALIPGTSRSGATIFGGMVSGLSRSVATEFSFLVALPVILAASGYDLVKHGHQFNFNQWQLLLFASFVAFTVAYVAVKLLADYVKKHTLIAFGIYRILFGLLLIYFFYFPR